MYYEEDGRKKRRHRRRVGFGGWLLKQLLRLIALLVVVLVILYAIPVSFFMTDSGGLNPSAGLDTDVINILLLGVDSLDDGSQSQRSDTMIIASIGYNNFKMTSVMRDTIVEIPGKGKSKLNAAYAHGGPELTVRTLNENFHLNITDYAVVDFVALAEIINAMGGIDMPITRAEMDEINKNVADGWRKGFQQRGYSQDDMKPLNVDFSNADENGRVTAHLDGFQALGFARIRSLDSDYMRTSRQRRVISAALGRLRSCWYDPKAVVGLIKAVKNNINTNIGIVEILSLGLKAAFCGDPGQLRLPADGTFTDNGSSLTNVDYGANLEVFKDFVYGD